MIRRGKLRPASTRIDPLGCGTETYYYRVELTVTDAAGLSTKQEVRLNPDCGTAPTYTFYRAINLNGPALTLDGNAWAGAAAPNYTTDGIAFANNAVPLLPATDAPRTGMIQSSVFRGGSLNLALTAVPAGTYQVYVWEDNFAQTFSLALNGQTVLANYDSGPAGTWAKLGPYTATLAAAGTLQLTTSGGDANFSGVELWQQSTAAAARQVATAQPLPTTNQPVQVFPNPSPDGRFKLLLPAAFQQGSTYTLLSGTRQHVRDGYARTRTGRGRLKFLAVANRLGRILPAFAKQKPEHLPQADLRVS